MGATVVWKPIPPDEQAEALADAQNNEGTMVHHTGTKKAKARIVLQYLALNIPISLTATSRPVLL